jgi:hypothetical protein
MIVTACCASANILQDAYINPNYPDETVNTFDNFICDNVDCKSYGSECSANDLTSTERT